MVKVMVQGQVTAEWMAHVKKKECKRKSDMVAISGTSGILCYTVWRRIQIEEGGNSKWHQPQ